MYTYGYIREATQAHIDLDEAETQAMKLQERYHIYANEAMQAICGVKPKYDYFECEIVEKYSPIVRIENDRFRKATSTDTEFADEIDTKLWYESQNIYLLDTVVHMPNDFISFAEKQAWTIRPNVNFHPELFIRGFVPTAQPKFSKVRATKEHFTYSGKNSLRFYKTGKYLIPYKGVWFIFKSGIGDGEEIDMPIDIILTIPLYIASLCLQIDHAQRALTKRAEFETALARCTNTDFLELKEV